MNAALQILSVTAVPGLSAAGESVLIRLELADGRAAWGAAIGLPDAQAAIQTVQQQVAPLWQTQPLTGYRPLAGVLDNLIEKVTIMRPVTIGAAVSRRGFITGWLADHQPEMEPMVVERPLPPALRFGLSQALLNAVALSGNQPAALVLADAYDLAPSTTAVPLHIEANAANIATVKPILDRHIAAFAYDIGAADYKATWGADAARLQRHVRQVKQWLATAAPAAHPAIHLNLQGGFTELYGHNEGKILGALYGLEQAAAPYQLVVENVVKGELTAVRQSLQQLHHFLQLRQMTVQLGAGYTLFTVEELRELAGEGTAVHHIHLNLAQSGAIHETLRFVLDCRARGVGVTLFAEVGVVETAVAVAHAGRAHALSGTPDKIYNETVKHFNNAGERGFTSGG